MIINKYMKNIKDNKKVAALLLSDAEKAFDAVWHNGLLKKLHDMELPSDILRIISSFLIDRTIQVKIGNTLSEVVELLAGTLHLFLYVYLFGVLRRFQHCTGHITTGSWKGRGNQYIQFVSVLYCKLPTNGKQLPAFPGLRGGRQECYHSATVGPGTLQGSILSPLLFILFVNDIPVTQTYQVTQYADDIAIYTSHQNPRYLEAHLHKQVDELEDWCEDWFIKINAKKTQLMMITHQNSRKIIPSLSETTMLK